MVKKQHVLVILLFSGLWGLSEAGLGGWMYSRGLASAAPVVLTAIALVLLTVARIYLPVAGTSALIGALAMLYKFLNEPFFACHLLAIFFLGAAFDAVYSLARGRLKPLVAVAATYLAFGVFAVGMTYVFRYEWWAAPGLPKVLRYVFVQGSLAAACGAAAVALADRLARRLAAGALAGPAVPRWASRAAGVVAICLWALAAVRPVLPV